MKDAEDEAFEDIERRQGGFQAKRAMAADKAQDETDMLTIAYLHGYDKGKKAALAQPAQEPVAWTLLLTDEHHGIIGAAGEKFIGAPEHYKRVDVYTTPPQREWVGLTNDEVKEIHNASRGKDVGIATGLTERKLKEKNT